MKREKKRMYQKPVVELLGMPVLQLLTPVSWDPDHFKGQSISLKIIEGDPEDDGNLGKGANNSDSFVENDGDVHGNVDMWDTI